ncbi:MAG: sigma 54-interacting transcriptional regulator [Bacillota bacterium]
MLTFPISGIPEDRLRSAWEEFVRTGRVDRQVVRPVIADSWARCRQHGLDPWRVERVAITGRELDGRLARRRAMIEAARPFMRSLHELVAGSGFVVCLCDEEGYLLELVGDADAEGEAEKIWLVPGVRWSEAVMGTSGIGVSLVTGSPIQVCGAEHYWVGCHSWTCSSAAVHDPDGRLIGVLTMSGDYRRVHPHTLGMVVAAAQAIENQLRAASASDRLLVAHRYLLATIESMSEGLVSVDTAGRVTLINSVAGRLLGMQAGEAVGRPLDQFLFRQLGLAAILESGREVVDRETNLELGTGRLHATVTAKPVMGDGCTVIGAMAILREMRSVRRLVHRMAGAQAVFTFDDIIGESPGFRRAVDLARAAAESSSTVLLQGESGTGKEMFAHAIHNAGRRRDGAFVAINCAAIPRELVGSELFGYAEGAFTGARREGSPGKFELADGGTIFLDEIGEMPLDMQAVLLRVLQDRQVVRIGGHRVTPVDVRVIASTNKNLSEAVARGSFRRDLYFRLNVFPIVIPPLRERKEDIPLLARHFLYKLNTKLGKSVQDVGNRALELLLAHDWPGNVRELENVIECAINVAQTGVLEPEHLMAGLRRGLRVAEGHITRPSVKRLADAERLAIAEALEQSTGNVAAAARRLGIARSSLYRKMRQYGIVVRRTWAGGTDTFLV